MAAEHTPPLKIGVIGAGTISQSVHIPSIHRAGLTLSWVCDLSASRAHEVAARTGARASTDPSEVFASDDVDAVLIATPGSHARLAAQAIRAGKHVLVEKPVALTLREIDELRDLAAEHSRVVQVGYMKMYDPLTATARTELEAARIDGASRRAILWKVYLPISLPAVGTLATLLFLFTWNEFLMPLVLVAQNPSVQTAPLALSFFAGNTRNFDPSVTAAAAVIVAIPIIIVYAILQRRFISGIVSGAVKE